MSNPSNNGFGKQGKKLLKSMAGRQMNIIKRRVMRGLGVLVMAGIAWAATQMGLISDKSDNNQATQVTEQNTSESQREVRQFDSASESQNSNTQSKPLVNSSSIKTLRLEDPLERGETHKVTNDMKEVKTRKHRRSNDNKKIAQLFEQQKSDTWVTAIGKVGKVLPDDNKGSRHQRFLMDIGQQKWLLIAHNIDLAPYVPLKQGDELVVYGEYEYNEKGGVIHWTHHDPRGYKDGGYIEHNNKRYE